MERLGSTWSRNTVDIVKVLTYITLRSITLGVNFILIHLKLFKLFLLYFNLFRNLIDVLQPLLKRMTY